MCLESHSKWVAELLSFGVLLAHITYHVVVAKECRKGRSGWPGGGWDTLLRVIWWYQAHFKNACSLVSSSIPYFIKDKLVCIKIIEPRFFSYLLRSSKGVKVLKQPEYPTGGSAN